MVPVCDQPETTIGRGHPTTNVKDTLTCSMQLLWWLQKGCGDSALQLTAKGGGQGHSVKSSQHAKMKLSALSQPNTVSVPHASAWLRRVVEMLPVNIIEFCQIQRDNIAPNCNIDGVTAGFKCGSVRQ